MKPMKKWLIIFALLLLPAGAFAGLSSDLQGKILLQVEQNGEAWYVNPVDLKRYYLGRPDDAYEIMRFLGLGITDADLGKVLAGDATLVNRLKGRILLQVEQHGEAYYIRPSDGSAHYMKDGAAAFEIMRSFGLGISDTDLATIPVDDTGIVIELELPEIVVVIEDEEDDIEEPDIVFLTLYAGVEQRTFEVINAHRVSIGVEAMTWNDVMADEARKHSERMASGEIEPSHEGFDDRITVIRASLPNYNGGAENLAWNYSSDPGQQSLAQWLTSAGHKSSLESDFYDVTGVGVAKASDGRYYVTQIFANTN